ncbi:ROK family protein [Leucobacter sp. W1478]|uniref:ROK family protein n=1 Tax=Leucobacter sp. W1478 TaxID=3439065 RepID=UPI003F3286F4
MSGAQIAIGIDVGGTGIKGAAIDVTTGARLTSRHRVPTPAGGTPGDIAHEVGLMTDAIRAELTANSSVPTDLEFRDRPGDSLSRSPDGVPSKSGSSIGGLPDERRGALPVGVTLPGVVQHGIMRTAANIDRSWIGADAAALFADAIGCPCVVINDADAAGLAEAAFGEVHGLHGTTLVLTFGTGIGSAMIHDGLLVPNFELGHLELDGHPDIERFASAKVIEREGITLGEWAERVERYLIHLELLFTPDRFVIGGSISKSADQYLPFAGVHAPVVPARFRNNAGIVGAAWLAARS